VFCVYSLVSGVSEWLPKWDFTLLQVISEDDMSPDQEEDLEDDQEDLYDE
jgi:hypothetical protein